MVRAGSLARLRGCLPVSLARSEGGVCSGRCDRGRRWHCVLRSRCEYTRGVQAKSRSISGQNQDIDFSTRARFTPPAIDKPACVVYVPTGGDARGPRRESRAGIHSIDWCRMIAVRSSLTDRTTAADAPPADHSAPRVGAARTPASPPIESYGHGEYEQPAVLAGRSLVESTA